jgi:3-hydroxy-9,10-secoandrosta-1,3,5(10)-triene-9,17-dione monooxygenase
MTAPSCQPETSEKIVQTFALIPKMELSIEDTWRSAGMKGTGSNTLIAEEGTGS